jgi:predicted nucleic acid-binding protein
MAQPFSVIRLPGITYAVSNTGPLISAFQSDSFALLTKIFPTIYLPTACVAELEKHGWGEEVHAALPQLVIVTLTANEEKRVLVFAEQIAQHPDTDDLVVEHHTGEAQAIVVALRSEHRDDLLLVDELAGRAIARQAGVKLSGFPGVLLVAVRLGLISAEELKARLERCREQGTHYGRRFIQHVYEMTQQGRREP